MPAMVQWTRGYATLERLKRRRWGYTREREWERKKEREGERRANR